MKIEKAIKQEVFKNEYHKAGINILYTASWLNLKQKKIFKAYGLTPPQYNVLRILRGQYPKTATVNLIIERMLDKSSNASRIVEKLRIKKMIKRVTCPEDRRAVNILITTEGLKLLDEMDKVENEFNIGISSLTPGEATLLSDLLDKIRNK